MTRLSRRRTLGLLTGTGLAGLSGCASGLVPFSRDDPEPATTEEVGDGRDSPLTVRRVRLDRTPAVVSTYQTAFSGPEADWAAQTVGVPESASLLIELDCSLSDGQRQPVTRLECVVYDESGIEQERWKRRLETAIEPGTWTLREQLGAELDSGRYIFELRLQVERDDDVETLAAGRVECSVVSPATYSVELPWDDLDSDRESELHVGLPYTLSVEQSDRRVSFADPVVQQLVTSAKKAKSDLPDWYLDELIGFVPDVPSLADERVTSDSLAADTAAVDLVDHGNDRVTLYWANQPVSADGSTVGTRYDRAFVIVTVGPEAVVTDPGGADYVFSEGERTETTLVWLPTRVGKRIEQAESVADRFGLAQHSFRVERAPPPPETETETPTPEPTASDDGDDPETTPGAATAVPTPTRPESVDVTAQVQLQLGPLHSRTDGSLTYGEFLDTTLDDVDGVYDVTAWQEQPEEAHWVTVGFTQTTGQAVFPVVEEESETDGDAEGVTPSTATPTDADSEDEGPSWRRGNWSTLGGDMARTGNGSPTVGVASGRSRGWRVETGSPRTVEYQRAVNSSPAIVDGTVYVGSNDGRVYAVDALTGEIQWQVRLDGPVTSSPTVVDEVLFVGSENGTLYALDCADGDDSTTADAEQSDVDDPEPSTQRTVWTATVGGPVRTAPAVAGSTVYVGGSDGTLSALSTQTGRTRWQTTVDEASTDAAVTTPTLAGDRVFVGSASGRLYAFGTGGRRRWRAEVESEIGSAAAVFDGTVYVGSDDGRVHALDVSDGTRRWEAEADGRVVGSPAVSREAVYAPSTDGRLYAFDRDDGAAQWAVETNDAILGSPALGGNTLYAGSRDGRLYAVDAWHGRVRWSRRLSGPVVFSSPAVVDGIVSVGTVDGALHGVLSFR